jgi:hypothetical protein
MRKLLQLFAVVSIACLFTGLNAGAQTFQIGMAPSAPTIDGTVDEVWNGVASYVAVDPTTWTPKADLRSLEDCSFKWSGLWDETNLYLLVQIMDDTTTIGSQAEGSAAINWMNDNIEMVLNDPAGAKQPYKYRFSFDRDNDPLVAINGPAGFVFETSAVTGGWVLEVSIPWSSLTNDSIDFSAYPAVDKVLSMNLVAADLDNVNGNNWDQLSGHIQWPKGWSATDVTLVAEAVVDATVPAAPIDVAASDITFGSATISWDAPVDDDVTGVLILKNGAPFSYVPPSTTSVGVDLSPEIEYTFTVIAVDAQNLSELSDPAIFTTLEKPSLKNAEIGKYTGTESNPFNDLDTWAEQPMFELTYGLPEDAADLGGYFRAMWDEDNLYIVTYVTDQEISNPDPVNGWANDNVEYHFDMGNERDGTSCEDVDQDKYHQDNFQYRAVPYKGEMQTGSTPAPTWTDISQATWEYYGEEGGLDVIGYYIEMNFPWNTLNTTSGLTFTPAEDAVFGFDMKVEDYDPAAEQSNTSLVWSSYDRKDLNRNNSEYGQIMLKGTATSIKNDFAKSFKVYPNPAVDNVTITLSTNGVHYIKLSDITGKQVLSTILENQGNHVINIRDLAPGMYMMTVEAGTQTGHVKLLVR